MVEDSHDGLLGFVRFRFAGALDIDCVALRVTRGGRIAFSWPERTDTRGKSRVVVRPVSDEARRDLEEQLLERIHGDLEIARARFSESHSRTRDGGARNREEGPA